MSSASSDKEIEELREANHRLKLSLENEKQVRQNEIEYLKDELQIKEKELSAAHDKIKAQSKKKDSESDEKLASLTDTYNLTREENADLKNQIQQLQRTVDQLRASQAGRQNFQEENESLKVAMDRLNIELENTRDLLEKQQSKVHDLTQQSLKHIVAFTELREQLEQRDAYISELQSSKKDLEKEKQEAIMELQHTVMMQSTAKQEVDDPNRRGNSLFSEVDERRVRVEQELGRLRERVARLTSENYELKSTIQKGDTRSAIFLQQLQIIHKSETDVVQEFRKLQSETIPMFNRYRDRLESMKNEYKRKLTQYRDGADSPAVGELEGIRQERDLLFTQKMALDQELWEMRKELKWTQQQLTEVEANCKIFRLKLQALQEEVMSGADKQKVDLDGTSFLDESTMNQTLGETFVGVDTNSNKKWLYNSILNDSRRSTGTSPPAAPLGNSRKVRAGENSALTAKKLQPNESDGEDACKQQ